MSSSLTGGIFLLHCLLLWCLEKKVRGHTDLNHGPIGLQPIALPLSYIPSVCLVGTKWASRVPCNCVECCGAKKVSTAVTRIRTWVTAATTQGTNHYTITASGRHRTLRLKTVSCFPLTPKEGLPASLAAFLNKAFSWCSGYHICLTHRRSPVRSRAKTSDPTWCSG